MTHVYILNLEDNYEHFYLSRRQFIPSIWKIIMTIFASGTFWKTIHICICIWKTISLIQLGNFLSINRGRI
jgi:hypothetical protein